jgi:eight-cysteine-cluster-containing protein
MARNFLLAFVAAATGCVSGQDSCYIGGCSSQVCSDRNDIVTTCEWLDVYECYRSARCEQQSDGACGWTPTQELNACLATHALTP